MLFRSDRKSTRLNSSHLVISYAVFCLKKKKNDTTRRTDNAYFWRGRIERPPSYFPVPRSKVAHSGKRQSGFFFNDTATTEIYPLSLHDARPICVAAVWKSSGAPLRCMAAVAICLASGSS